jgi:hypothetical protein
LPDIEKVQPLIWGGMGNNHYFAVGEKLGQSFSIGKRFKV